MLEYGRGVSYNFALRIEFPCLATGDLVEKPDPGVLQLRWYLAMGLILPRDVLELLRA
eukprot:SAG31_NODE_8393_length_1460_cov_1.161646_1_plen_57_part_10